MKAKSNAKPIAFPRQVAMYLCRKLTDLSYPEIGRLFNDKHHSTVMHSVEKIERLAEDDPNFRKVIESFLAALPLTAAPSRSLFPLAAFSTRARRARSGIARSEKSDARLSAMPRFEPVFRAFSSRRRRSPQPYDSYQV